MLHLGLTFKDEFDSQWDSYQWCADGGKAVCVVDLKDGIIERLLRPLSMDDREAQAVIDAAAADYKETPLGRLLFTRRRYGRKTFTWVDWLHNGVWHSLDNGSPWPCVNPARAELEREIERVKGLVQCTGCNGTGSMGNADCCICSGKGQRQANYNA